MKSLCLLTFALSLAIPRPAKAGLRVDEWTVEQGLPQNSVQAIVQSQDGYLWLGTSAGPVRFDGIRFVESLAGQSPPISQDRVMDLHQDPKGVIWAALRDSPDLLRITTEGATLVSSEGKIPREGARHMVGDHEGRLWIATRAGLVRFSGKRFEVLQTDTGDLSRIQSMHVDPHGVVWIVTDANIYRWSDNRFVPVPMPMDGVCVLEDLAVERDGTMWIATECGLRRWRQQGPSIMVLRDELPHPYVKTLLIDRQGALWIGTKGGVGIYRTSVFTSLAAHSTVTRGNVESLFEDREGSLWVGTLGGLARVRPAVFESVQPLRGIAPDAARVVLEGRDKSIWFGTEDGLYRLKDNVVSIFGRRQGLQGDVIYALAETREGVVFVGSGDGLARIEGDHAVPVNIGLRGQRKHVLSLLQDRTGLLWVGTQDDGVLKIRGDAVVGRIGRAEGLPSGDVKALLEDRAGVIWLATTAGLVALRDTGIEVLSTKQGLPSDLVYTLHESATGDLWAGTRGGLVRVKGKSVRAFTVRDGLVHNTIHQILDDGQGYFWLSGREGISRVSQAELKAVEAGERPSLTTLVYGRRDGLPAAECYGGSQPAGVRTSDGRLWFPTSLGFASVFPAHLKPNPLEPPVFIEEVMAGGSPFVTTNDSTLPSGRGSLLVRFAALSLAAPERVKIRYQLEGADSDWITAGSSRTALYPRLSAGAYRFRVVAANDDGVWNLRGASFSFQVGRPFYQSPWFIACALLAVGCFAWGLDRLHVLAVERRFQAILADRARVARELHDGLNQTLVGLGLHLDTAAKELQSDPASTRQQLEAARALVQGSQVEARRFIWDLREQPSGDPVDLAAALKEALQELTNGTPTEGRFLLEGSPRKLPDVVSSNTLRVGKEAMINAVKHAAARSVSATLQFRDRSLRLVVKDDGRGWNPDAINGPATGHFGVLGMRERAASVGGRLEIKTAPGQGTEVLWEVPLTK